MSNFKSTNPNSGNGSFKKWDLWSVNDYMVCKLKDDSREDKFKKPIYDVEIVESSFDDLKPGQMFVMNATGGLVKKMSEAEVDIGQTFKVVYLGKNKITKGQWAGTMAHNIDVQLPTEATEDDSSAL